jgi:hypothetical protein
MKVYVLSLHLTKRLPFLSLCEEFTDNPSLPKNAPFVIRIPSEAIEMLVVTLSVETILFLNEIYVFLPEEGENAVQFKLKNIPKEYVILTAYKERNGKNEVFPTILLKENIEKSPILRHIVTTWNYFPPAL